MKVRTGRHEGARGLILALAIFVPLAGCTTSPRTQLDWGVNDRVHHKTVVASRAVRAPVRRQYAYRAAAIVPTPRPAQSVVPGWYRPTPRPAQSDAAVAQTSGDVRFVWPTGGHVITEFGAADNGERSDGINIAAPSGQPIRAAADGTVSYAGNDLKSYGNLVLIRHGDDYVTAYAHAERMVVNRGDSVTKGQIIAYVGSTGDVSQPQLHFEIRHGVHPVDPRPLLGPLQVVASR